MSNNFHNCVGVSAVLLVCGCVCCNLCVGVDVSCTDVLVWVGVGVDTSTVLIPTTVTSAAVLEWTCRTPPLPCRHSPQVLVSAVGGQTSAL